MKNKENSFSDILHQLDKTITKNIKIKYPRKKSTGGGRKPNKLLADAEWLLREYESSNVKQLAEKIGVTRRSVLYWLDKHGIPRRDPAERIAESNRKRRVDK